MHLKHRTKWDRVRGAVGGFVLSSIFHSQEPLKTPNWAVGDVMFQFVPTWVQLSRWSTRMVYKMHMVCKMQNGLHGSARCRMVLQDAEWSTRMVYKNGLSLVRLIALGSCQPLVAFQGPDYQKYLQPCISLFTL